MSADGEVCAINLGPALMREAGIDELFPAVLSLAVFTVIAMTLAALRFTKRLD